MDNVININGCGSRFLYKSGDIVGGVYKVVRRLGKGGMGCVYEVEHPNLGIHYALKTFTMSSGRVELLRKRFLAEGKVLARLRHQNLVRVFDLGFDEVSGTPFFVMDLVLDKDGRARTLDDIKQGEVDENQLFRWFVQLCSVLDYIHEKGIVHRDIKPSNILIDGNGCVVLTDFGISRYVTDELRKDLSLTRMIISGKIFTSTMNIKMGTELFMAPEVKIGKPATAASDAYSLGLVFFHLLTGVWYYDSPGVFDLLDAMEKRWRHVLPWLLQEKAGLRPQVLTMAAEDLCVEKLGTAYVLAPSHPPLQMDATTRQKPFWEDLCVEIASRIIRFPAFLSRVVRRARIRASGPERIKLPRSSRFVKKSPFLRYLSDVMFVKRPNAEWHKIMSQVRHYVANKNVKRVELPAEYQI